MAPDLTGHKKSDWPAYRASGYRTMIAFEEDFIRCRVEGVNTANLFWRITSPELRNGIELTSSVQACADPIEVGIWACKFNKFFLEVEELTFR